MMMLSEITLLRAIGICLVVFGHSDIFNQATPQCFFSIEKVLYSFHMPLFMFISGFVFIYTNYRKDRFDFTTFIKKKVIRLLFPAWIVLTFAYLFRYLLFFIKGVSNDKSSYCFVNYFKMFFLKEYLPIEFFWFIFTLSSIFLFSQLILYVIKKNNYFLISILSIFLTILNLLTIDIDLFYINYIFYSFIFFWFGCIVCWLGYVFSFFEYKDKFKLLNNRIASLILFFVFLVLLIVFNQIDKSIKIAGLASAISGIIASFFLSCFIKKFNFMILLLIGEYSYQIFLLCWFFHRLVETIGFQKMNLSFYITFPLSFLLAIIGPLLVSIFIVKKMPRLKIFIGL